jgi:hypothetical protein
MGGSEARREGDGRQTACERACVARKVCAVTNVEVRQQTVSASLPRLPLSGIDLFSTEPAAQARVSTPLLALRASNRSQLLLLQKRTKLGELFFESAV